MNHAPSIDHHLRPITQQDVLTRVGKYLHRYTEQGDSQVGLNNALTDLLHYAELHTQMDEHTITRLLKESLEHYNTERKARLEKRQTIIDRLVEFRLTHAQDNRAVFELLEDAFRHGRTGYEQFTDHQLQNELEEWHLHDQED